MNKRHPKAPWRNFYGRRHGKTLRSSQREYLSSDLDSLTPGPVDWDVNPDRDPLDLEKLFGVRDVWIEIGFGGGEHLVHQAMGNPDVALIGCEPFINGVAMLLGRIRSSEATNIRVHPGDVRDLFDLLPEGIGCMLNPFVKKPQTGHAVIKTYPLLQIAT